MSANNKQDSFIYSRNKRILINSLTILLLVGVLIWGLSVYFHLWDRDYTEDAQVEEYINPINTRISGFLESIKFSEHQNIKKGDTIAIIDDKEYVIQLQQAYAALKDAQAGKVVISGDVNLSANSTNISNANIEEIEARLANQKTNLDRYTNLLKEDVIPQYQYDEVKTEYDVIKAKYEALLHQRTSTQISTRSTSQKLNISEAAIMKARAAVDMAKLNIQYCLIRAPYDGIMGRRKIEEGQLVQAGQTLSFIVKARDKWVTANYTESQIENIHPGDRMRIKADAVKGIVYTGRVAAISGATGSQYSSVPVDNSTGNFVKVQQRFPVKIELLNKPEELEKIRAGMNVEVTRY